MAGLVQYIVLRRDLAMPPGVAAAQAAHAAVLSVSTYAEDEETRSYLSLGLSMRTVVLWAEDLEQLKEVEHKLQQSGVKTVLWVEQPEDEVTALATAPTTKAQTRAALRRLRLC